MPFQKAIMKKKTQKIHYYYSNQNHILGAASQECHDFFILLLLIFVSSSSTIGVLESRIHQSGNSLKADSKNSNKPSKNSLKLFANKDKKDSYK